MKLVVKNARLKQLRENPVCLITGDGNTLLADLQKADDLKIAHDVMAIGRSINADLGRVLHWANVDAADAKWWAEHLPLKRDGQMPIRHTLGEYDWMDVAWDVVDGILWDPAEVLWHGSTALFAVYACLAMGYERIILAGCPLDGNGHWHGAPGPRWSGECYQAWLEFARTPEAKRVESLSGYTRQILGGQYEQKGK